LTALLLFHRKNMMTAAEPTATTEKTPSAIATFVATGEDVRTYSGRRNAVPLQAVAPLREYVPEGHREHVEESVAPVALEKDPSSQLMQAVKLAAPVALEYVPSGHRVHVAELKAPTTLE
jgi:hypothetical protein